MPDERLIVWTIGLLINSGPCIGDGLSQLVLGLHWLNRDVLVKLVENVHAMPDFAATIPHSCLSRRGQPIKFPNSITNFSESVYSAESVLLPGRSSRLAILDQPPRARLTDG